MKTIFSSVAESTQSSLWNKCHVACIALLLVIAVRGQAQEKEWDRTFGGSRSEYLYEVEQTSDGGYILGGYSSSGISGEKSEENKGVCYDLEDVIYCTADYWVVKLNTKGNIEWERTLGGNNEDFLYSIQQTSDGGYILGGASWSGVSGDKSEDSRGYNDYWIVKLDVNGNKEWDRSYGGDNTDELYSLQQTRDGGYILGGFSTSSISGDKTEANRGAFEYPLDYWIVKIDSEGNKEWDKTFGGDKNDFLTSLQHTSDGGYILGGHSNSGISGEKTEANRGVCDQGICPENYWVVKLGAGGIKEWDKTIGGDRFDYLQELHQTSDGGYVLGGYSYSGISGDKTEASRGFGDYWVVKLQANGNKEWDRTFGGDEDDYLRSLHQTSDGGYILGGASNSGKSGDKTEAKYSYAVDYWILKLNGNGAKEWDRTYGGGNPDADWDYLTFLQQTSDGGYVLGGYSPSPISGDKSEPSRGEFDYWVVKLSGEEPCTPLTTAISVVSNSNIYTGGDPNTIYLGYGPQSVQLVATGGNRYFWSPSSGLKNTEVADPVFTPTAAGSYTFTVMAYSGDCFATATVTIKVIDVRCGNGKVQVCHNGRTLCLASSAVAAHLRNHTSDRLGSCQEEEPPAENLASVTVPLKVFPNPFRELANVEFSLPVGGPFRFELYNASGKMLGLLAEGEGESGQVVRLELRSEHLREGIYYLRLTTPDQVQTQRLVLQK